MDTCGLNSSPDFVLGVLGGGSHLHYVVKMQIEVPSSSVTPAMREQKQTDLGMPGSEPSQNGGFWVQKETLSQKIR